MGENWMNYHMVDFPNFQVPILEFCLLELLGLPKNYANFVPTIIDFYALRLVTFFGIWPLDETVGNSPWLHGLIGIPGLVPTDIFYSKYAEWSRWPENPVDAFDPANQGYTDADLLGTYEWAFDPNGHMIYPYDK